MTDRQSPFGSHISTQYDEELEDIRQKLLAMGGLVEKQIDDGLRALLGGDSALGEAMVRRDVEVNAMEVDIDEECTRVIARRQPTAGDLRILIGMIKSITDLERVGDEACKLGKAVIEPAADQPLDRALGQGIQRLGRHVQDMLHEALDAFARLDAESALRIAREESRVDDEYDALARQFVTYIMEDPRTIQRVLGVMWSARALERISDHARNLCEYVVYVVEGQDIRHQDLSAARDALETGSQRGATPGETPE
jgi:phosphate transport system protein